MITAAYWNTCVKEIHYEGWKKRILAPQVFSLSQVPLFPCPIVSSNICGLPFKKSNYMVKSLGFYGNISPLCSIHLDDLERFFSQTIMVEDSQEWLFQLVVDMVMHFLQFLPTCHSILVSYTTFFFFKCHIYPIFFQFSIVLLCFALDTTIQNKLLKLSGSSL